MRIIRRLLLVGTFVSWAVPQTAIALSPAMLSLQPGVGLSLTGTTGIVYTIQSTTNLALPGAWQTVSAFKLLASPGLVPGTAPVTGVCRFYRAVVFPQTRLVYIPAGTFTMGSPDSETDRYADEGPQSTVTISQGFWMGVTEVTQQEYESVMGTNPSDFTGDPNRPVEQVRWSDATNYCALLTARDFASGTIPAGFAYRLPSEAEWEYACRAGTSTRFYYGDDPAYANLASHAWYSGNSGGQTHAVGQKPANPWGLYDICGNVWEWCQDWYDTYAGGSVTDPHGPATGQFRVLRGGSWDDPAWFARSACRFGDDPAGVYNFYGFRVVLAPASP